MENQNKATAFQWIVPSAAMIIVVVIMLFNFVNKSRNETEKEITRNLTDSVGEYGEQYLADLQRLRDAALPAARLFAKEGTLDKEFVADVLDAVTGSSKAYKVYYCDESGAGVSREGNDVSVAQFDYFQAIKDADEDLYIYTDEGEYLSRKTVVVSLRVAEADINGYLLMYYPMDEFRNLLRKSELEEEAFLVLIDSEGKILGNAGRESVFLESGNLFDAIQAQDPERAKTVISRINIQRGDVDLMSEEGALVMAYTALGINDWKVVLGINSSYVDRQVENQSKMTRNMLTELASVVIVFMCVVVFANVIGKIRSNEKKRQLEDKADTDLLTGLNNKLATERKIKDYMAKHPDSQSMMFILDIDNFKKINDTMGHAFGDEVLRSLGKQIGAIFRATDIIGRAGGDEFMIFLKGIDSAEAIRKEAKKVETFFKGFQAGEYVKYAATASIGVAIFPQEGADFETLYKAADQGLYKAKKRGKNQLAFYRDEWVKEEDT